jgi:hypothetical protein
VFDTLLVETMEGLINNEVRDQLYVGGIELLQTYRELKKRLVTISGILERKKLWKTPVA